MIQDCGQSLYFPTVRMAALSECFLFINPDLTTTKDALRVVIIIKWSSSSPPPPTWQSKYACNNYETFFEGDKDKKIFNPSHCFPKAVAGFSAVLGGFFLTIIIVLLLGSGQQGCWYFYHPFVKLWKSFFKKIPTKMDLLTFPSSFFWPIPLSLRQINILLQTFNTQLFFVKIGCLLQYWNISLLHIWYP